mmetsp:Transcript_7381/g.8329  ORF Transcript_7381/g.8329 Transcript_7381/m.8329 type:complete len:95 (+) Transcript_7381:42-326(+)
MFQLFGSRLARGIVRPATRKVTGQTRKYSSKTEGAAKEGAVKGAPAEAADANVFNKRGPYPFAVISILLGAALAAPLINRDNSNFPPTRDFWSR